MTENENNGGVFLAMITIVVIGAGVVVGMGSSLLTNAAGSFSDRNTCAELNENWIEFEGCFHIEGGKRIREINVTEKD